MGDGAVYMGYTPAQLDEQYNPRLTEPKFQSYFNRWAKQGAKARRARSAMVTPNSRSTRAIVMR